MPFIKRFTNVCCPKGRSVYSREDNALLAVLIELYKLPESNKQFDV